LHGAYSAHEEISAALEPILASRPGYRRLYPDLPGMGATLPDEALRGSGDVVDLLGELISAEIGAQPFYVVGHSYGAHLARGLAARHPDQIAGLALICPLLPTTTSGEPHVVVRAEGDASTLVDPAHVNEFTGYFVIHTPQTAARFRQALAPVVGRFDGEAVERIMNDMSLDPDPDESPYEGPTLVATGRHDSAVGYRDQLELLSVYPRARYVAVADAGHALPHEHPDLLANLIDAWLSGT
jgi:pimeloyl-ACP methyl ester carboxylesterase